jgi:hypothetical protein
MPEARPRKLDVVDDFVVHANEHALGEQPRVPTRKCGRCRLTFEGDPSLDPVAQRKWWLCPQCRVILLPARYHRALRAEQTSTMSAS